MSADTSKNLHISLSRRGTSERVVILMRDGHEALLTIRQNQATFSRPGIAEGREVESGILRPRDVLFVEYWQADCLQAFALFQYIALGVVRVLYCQGFEFTTYAVNLEYGQEAMGRKKAERVVHQQMGTQIDPVTDKLVFVRFRQHRILELVVRNASGAWIWYETAFCRRDQKTYLIETGIGEPDVLPVYCHNGELAGIFWADPDLLPESRIDVLAGGPCIRLVQLPTFLREESFQAFCTGLGYAAEMIPCIYCQDMLPISGTVPEESQQPCEHIAWCPVCNIWSSPYFPGKEEEMVHCSHRTPDDLHYAGAKVQ